METSDKQFFLTFMGVTGAIVLIAVAVFVAAQVVGAAGHRPEKSAAQIKIAKARIEPVGLVNLKSNPAAGQSAVAPVTAAAPAAAANPGEAAYNSSGCGACHGAGVAGAPKLGDIAGWKPRISLGIETLYTSAIKGKGIMPAKGGNPALSDDDIKLAVDYMVEASQ